MGPVGTVAVLAALITGLALHVQAATTGPSCATSMAPQNLPLPNCPASNATLADARALAPAIAPVVHFHPLEPWHLQVGASVVTALQESFVQLPAAYCDRACTHPGRRRPGRPASLVTPAGLHRPPHRTWTPGLPQRRCSCPTSSPGAAARTTLSLRARRRSSCGCHGARLPQPARARPAAGCASCRAWCRAWCRKVLHAGTEPSFFCLAAQELCDPDEQHQGRGGGEAAGAGGGGL